MQITCKRCGHSWDTKSDHVYVSCPSCMKKLKIREFKEKDADEKQEPKII